MNNSSGWIDVTKSNVACTIDGTGFIHILTTDQLHINDPCIVKGLTRPTKNKPTITVFRPPTHTMLQNLRLTVINDLNLGSRSGLMGLAFVPFRHANDFSAFMTSLTCYTVSELKRFSNYSESASSEVAITYKPKPYDTAIYGYKLSDQVLGAIVFTTNLENISMKILPTFSDYSYKLVVEADYSHYSCGPRNWIYQQHPFLTDLPDAVLYYNPKVVVPKGRTMAGFDCAVLTRSNFTVTNGSLRIHGILRTPPVIHGLDARLIVPSTVRIDTVSDESRMNY